MVRHTSRSLARFLPDTAHLIYHAEYIAREVLARTGVLQDPPSSRLICIQRRRNQSNPCPASNVKSSCSLHASHTRKLVHKDILMLDRSTWPKWEKKSPGLSVGLRHSSTLSCLAHSDGMAIRYHVCSASGSQSGECAWRCNLGRSLLGLVTGRRCVCGVARQWGLGRLVPAKEYLLVVKVQLVRAGERESEALS